MRLLRLLAPTLAALTLATSAHAGIFYVLTPSATTVAAGGTFTLGIHAETDTPEALALGLRALFDDSVLSVTSVTTRATMFDFNNTTPFGGLTNSGNGLAGTVTAAAPPLSANVNLFQGVSVAPAASTGSTEGDQFMITFMVDAGAADGMTTIDVGAFAQFADTYAGGDNAQTPGAVTITIPEPTAVASSAAALVSVLGVAGYRRRTLG